MTETSKQGLTPGPWAYGGLNVGEANARLIAAAPDLYAALERVTKAHTDGEALDCGWVEEATAALAKARGEVV